MKIYLVGGAVRDGMLNIPVKERDWCVVGATPEQMLALGYRQVGKDFPVFLHPKTGEEYALARTERKTAPGYHGFDFNTSPNVTLEEDLSRRDLTVNAIAQDESGRVIDPWGGVADIEARILRHVSPAYSEDPVRILRTAKFCARFADAGFKLAGETMGLMTQMVKDGEADALAPERVWKETELSLIGPNPQLYFRVLQACGALAVTFPQLEALFGVPQPAKWHPEIDSGIHTLMVLEQVAKLSEELDVRFAALVHDLGKGTTPRDTWPSHHGHEARGAKLVEAIAKKLPLPRNCRELGALVAKHHVNCHCVAELRPDTMLRILEQADAFRRPERFSKFLLACEADSRGRSGFEDRPYPQAAIFAGALAAANEVSAKDLVAENLAGAALGKELGIRRLAKISHYKQSLATSGS